jgi:hypothetical protein
MPRTGISGENPDFEVFAVLMLKLVAKKLADDDDDVAHGDLLSRPLAAGRLRVHVRAPGEEFLYYLLSGN